MDKRIMVVDDEKDIVDLLKASLERDGYQVVGFYNGEDAYQYFKNHPVELVISDVRMPGMAGTDLFLELRKLDPFLQVIFATAYPSLEQMAQMLETGATDFVIKPFKLEHMKNIVKETFEKIDRWRGLCKDVLRSRRPKINP